MDISVSSLGFCGHAGFSMGKLANDIGIEIFYEWGGEKYWELAVKKAYENGRTGTFSIHAPFQGDIVEMSLVKDVNTLYDYLKEPFKLYHMFNGDGYVVHMNAPYAKPCTPAEKVERLKLVEERLAKMNDICKKEGVTMLVENLAFGTNGYTLCEHADFMKIFENNKELNCIIDTGHAVLGGIDIFDVQKTLGSRLRAYHMHDNNGITDGHKRICTGVIDWEKFFEGARLYTPDANFVMEYNPDSTETVEDYMTDAAKIREMMAK